MHSGTMIFYVLYAKQRWIYLYNDVTFFFRSWLINDDTIGQGKKALQFTDRYKITLCR